LAKHETANVSTLSFHIWPRLFYMEYIWLLAIQNFDAAKVLYHSHYQQAFENTTKTRQTIYG